MPLRSVQLPARDETVIVDEVADDVTGLDNDRNVAPLDTLRNREHNLVDTCAAAGPPSVGDISPLAANIDLDGHCSAYRLAALQSLRSPVTGPEPGTPDDR